MRRALAAAVAALLAVALTGCNDPITVLTPAPEASVWSPPPPRSETPTPAPTGKAAPSGKPSSTPSPSASKSSKR